MQWPIPIMEKVWPFGKVTEREEGGGFSAKNDGDRGTCGR